METDQRQVTREVMRAEDEHLEGVDSGVEESVQENSWLLAGAVLLLFGGLAVLLSTGSGVGAFAGGMLIFLGVSFAGTLFWLRTSD